MYKSKTLNLIINSLIIIISLITAIYLFNQRPQLDAGYENIYLLPLAYLICHILFIRKVMKNYGISMFLGVYITVSFFRYVLISTLIVIAHWFYGRAIVPPEPIFYRKAIWLMIYELLAYDLAILLFCKYFFKPKRIERKDNTAKNINVNYSKNNVVYIAFIILTILLLAIRPSALTFFSFLSVNENFSGLNQADTLTAITTIFLNTSRILIYLLVIRWLMINIHPKNPTMSFIIILIVTIINSLIFFGTNRSDFIFNFIVNLVILMYLYKKLGVTVSAILITLIPIVIESMSTYRQSTTITKGANKLIDFTDNLQVYLGGIYNVALSLDMSSPNSQPIILLVDIFRSAFGPNLILKHFNIVPSVNLFNNRIYLSDHVAQIIPMIGQSYLYLGFIFSPILGIGFIFIAVFLVQQIIKVNRLELIYILTLFSGRLGFVMAQNGNILLNDLTFFLPLFLIVYYLNNKVVIKK